MEWISVKDRLAELEKEVLATDGEIIRVAAMENGIEEWTIWTYYDYLEWHNVTHWAFLPPMPDS